MATGYSLSAIGYLPLAMTTGFWLFAFILSTLYGAGFHLWLGGGARQLLLYLLAAWVGFAAGHVAADLINLTWLSAGALHIVPASVGSLLALFISRWLAERNSQTQN
jgi:hypothetical protein